MSRAHGDEIVASPLFGGVSQEDWAVLLSHATRLDLGAGQPVFLQGGAADSFYAVLSGTVEVRTKNAKGPERVAARLTGGSVLGETSLFLGGEHSASVYTSEPSTLLRFQTADFMELIEQKQTGAIRVLFNMGLALAARFRSATDPTVAAPGSTEIVRNVTGHVQRYMS